MAWQAPRSLKGSTSYSTIAWEVTRSLEGSTSYSMIAWKGGQGAWRIRYPNLILWKHDWCPGAWEVRRPILWWRAMSAGLGGCASYSMKVCSVWEARKLLIPFYARGGRGFNILLYDSMRSGPEPEGFHVLFYDGMKSVQGPGGFNILFYDGIRSVPGPGGFAVLFCGVMRSVQGLGGSTSYSMMAWEVSRGLEGSTSCSVVSWEMSRGLGGKSWQVSTCLGGSTSYSMRLRRGARVGRQGGVLLVARAVLSGRKFFSFIMKVSSFLAQKWNDASKNEIDCRSKEANKMTLWTESRRRHKDCRNQMSSFFSSSPAFSSWASPMDMCPRVQPEWFTYIVDHASASLSAISPGRRSSSPAWSSELCSRAFFFSMP